VFPGRLSLARRKAWTPTPFPVDDYRQIVDLIRRTQRIDDDFVFAVGGYTDDRGAQNDQLLEAYARVGVNWWVENLHDFRGGITFAERRVLAGPPQAKNRIRLSDNAHVALSDPVDGVTS
jgi:hypothetical protein